MKLDPKMAGANKSSKAGPEPDPPAKYEWGGAKEGGGREGGALTHLPSAFPPAFPALNLIPWIQCRSHSPGRTRRMTFRLLHCGSTVTAATLLSTRLFLRIPSSRALLPAPQHPTTHSLGLVFPRLNICSVYRASSLLFHRLSTPNHSLPSGIRLRVPHLRSTLKASPQSTSHRLLITHRAISNGLSI